MSDVAAELGAPGIRVFGDTIQPGADRDSTRKWIAESIRNLADRTAPKGVQVWLETHGDFVAAGETAAILRECSSPQRGVVWDPVNSLVATGEQLAEGRASSGIGDSSYPRKGFSAYRRWRPICSHWRRCLSIARLKRRSKTLQYSGFVSFEWEKKWHPELQDPVIAVPHFAKRFARAA